MAAFSRSAFGSSGGSSSWADDDEDTAPLPFASTLPKVEEQQQQQQPGRAESPRRDEPAHRERKQSNEYRERGHDRRTDHHQGGYEDRGGGGGGYRNERSGRGGGYDGDRVERPKNPVPDQGPFKVYFGNLPFRATENDIADFFNMGDAVTDVRLQYDQELNRPKGFAYVEFSDREALVEALKLDGQTFDGRAVRIDVAADNSRKTRQSTNSFFEKRGDRENDHGSRYERRGREDAPRQDAPRERPRLHLAPRTNETNKPEDQQPTETKKQSIFGEAKPRDESAFWERKKAEAADKPKHGHHDHHHHGKKSGPRSERKTSHDDAEGPRAAGRGGRGGRGGERTERAEKSERVIERGGRGGERTERAEKSERVIERGGRGGRGERTERGGRGGRGPAAAPVAAADAATPAKKEEPAAKPKTVEPKLPKAAKLPAPPSTKTKNAFDALGLDDSDSD